MEQAGLYEDLPYPSGGDGGKGGDLTAEAAEELPIEGEVNEKRCRVARTFLWIQTLFFSPGAGRLFFSPFPPFSSFFFDAGVCLDVFVGRCIRSRSLRLSTWCANVGFGLRLGGGGGSRADIFLWKVIDAFMVMVREETMVYALIITRC